MFNLRTTLGGLLVTLTCWACNTVPEEIPGRADKPESLSYEVPVAGTVVDSLVQKILDDDLNDRYFKVRILATSASATGLFNLELIYGHNFNSTEITLPAWTDNVILKPEIKAGDKPYHCLIGFDAGDGVFRELYQVSTTDGTIRLKQTMSYVIEQ